MIQDFVQENGGIHWVHQIYQTSNCKSSKRISMALGHLLHLLHQLLKAEMMRGNLVVCFHPFFHFPGLRILLFLQQFQLGNCPSIGLYTTLSSTWPIFTGSDGYGKRKPVGAVPVSKLNSFTTGLQCDYFPCRQWRTGVWQGERQN